MRGSIRRVFLVLGAAAAPALLAGCNGAATSSTSAEAAAVPPGPIARDKQKADSQDAKTGIVRALLQSIDELDGGSSDDKDALRKNLKANDEILAKALNDKNSKKLIEKANQLPKVRRVQQPGPKSTDPKKADDKKPLEAPPVKGAPPSVTPPKPDDAFPFPLGDK